MRVEFRATELPKRGTRQFGVVSVGKSGKEVALAVREDTRAKALSAAAVLVRPNRKADTPAMVPGTPEAGGQQELPGA